MRKLLISILCIMTATLCWAEDNFSTTVGTESITISVGSKVLPTEIEVGDTVAIGDVVTLDGGRTIYLSLEAGVVAADPAGVIETVASPILRKCTVRRGRTALRRLVIFEAVSGDIWWTLGEGDAEVGKGVTLKEGERMWIGDPGSLKCISEGSATVTTQELY